MKASAELNSSIAEDLQKDDPEEQDAMAAIQENKEKPRDSTEN